MFKSLQWRLVLILILIIVALMFFVGVTLNGRVQSSYYKVFEDKIKSGLDNWDIIKGKPTAEDIYNDLSEKRHSIITFRTSDGFSLTVLDKASNKVVYSSDTRYADNHDQFSYQILKSENLNAVMAGGDKGNTNKQVISDDSNTLYFDYATGVKNGYILYFRYYDDEWGKIIGEFNSIIIITCLLAILFSLGLGYALSKTITVPIVRIMHKAQDIASGNFDQPLPVKSNDEIGKLTKTFNYMAGELKDTLGEISNEKNKVETILNNMTDGVIAFNINGEMIHINPVAESILSKNDFKCDFNTFSRLHDLSITLEEILYMQTVANDEKIIAIGDRTIKVNFVLFKGEEDKPGGIIIVLQDITEQEKLENMRRDFVANVSHELRTPLTSIKSYAETLLDGASEEPETMLRFLGVINSEADRMTRLVKDLLQLTKIENRQVQWNMKDLMLSELVADSVEKMCMEAKNKGLILENYVIGDIPVIQGDYDRIEQVVLNILSNAIKYTPAGGKITMYTSKLYNDVYVKVADTGVGIPQADVDRIFERFYRVDKARSREMGGTGLGLSIAKEIVEAHGGTILVSSTLGKGTEITVKLPICNSNLNAV